MRGTMRIPRLNRIFGMSAVVTGAAIALVIGTLPAQASTLPLQGEASAFLNSTLVWNYGASPAGANQRCTPSAAHPYPVVLVEGTFASMYNSFGAISPDLVNNGYCVYAFNYGQTLPFTGIYATGAIAASAAQLSAEVSNVLAQTHAAKVDMLVGFAPSNYGTTLDGVVNLVSDLGILGLTTALLSVTCTACAEQIQGSSFLASLNATPTAPGVKYVVIETADDEVVTPYTNAFLPAGPNVQNITLQSQCPQDGSDHLSIPYDSNALQDMVNALGADSPTFQPACAAVGAII